MDRTTTLTRLAAAALAAGLAAILAAPAGAVPAAGPAGAVPAAGAVTADPEQLAALARDLGLDRQQALARLAGDLAASRTGQTLRERLATGYAGAWLTAGGQLVVATTEPDQLPVIRAAGAQARLVQHTEQALAGAAAALDRAPAPAASEVYSWGVDPRTNQVVVRAAPAAVVRVRAWVLTSGADPEQVRVEASTDRPAVAWDIIGGNRYTMPGGSFCSIGFSVRRGPGDWGYVTAGHCGTVGTTTNAFNGSSTIQLGTFANSNFPGVDMAYVKARIYAGCTRPNHPSCWFPRPWVNQYAAGGNLVVTGQQVAPVGAAICRSGTTTGWRCGTVTATNQTVNYAEGTVNGLTFTTACVEGGDSGGAYVALGTHAQGVTSGGTTPLSCGLADRISFFQPLNPILASYGLTLVTG